MGGENPERKPPSTVVSLEAQTQRKDGVEVVLCGGGVFPIGTSQLLSEKGRLLSSTPMFCSSNRWSKYVWDFSSRGGGDVRRSASALNSGHQMGAGSETQAALQSCMVSL